MLTPAGFLVMAKKRVERGKNCLTLPSAQRLIWESQSHHVIPTSTGSRLLESS